MNDGRRAAPCASSYSLFEPEDQVMEHNLMYYKAYSEQWGLQSDHFTARMVREMKVCIFYPCLCGFLPQSSQNLYLG